MGAHCKDQIQTPVAESRKRISSCSNLGWEDLCRIHPGDDASHGEKEAEDKVHGNHGAEGIGVGIWIIGQDIVLGQNRVNQ